MFNFWENYEESVDVIILSLFFIYVAFIKKEPSFFMQLFHCHSPSSSFLVKNPGINSIYTSQKEKETIDFPQQKC